MILQSHSLSTNLPPFHQSPATQKFLISNPARDALRLRFRVQYNMNGAIVSVMGDFASLQFNFPIIFIPFAVCRFAVCRFDVCRFDVCRLPGAR